jgi:hypothetical protein
VTALEVDSVGVLLAKAAVDQGLTPGELRGSTGASAALRLGVEAAAGVGHDEAGWPEALVALDLACERAVRASGKLTRCSSCDQPVRWVLTVAGKRMPLDPLPHPMGNVVFAIAGKSSVVMVVAPKDLPVAAVSFRAHFATCPYAAANRSQLRKVPAPRCASCGTVMDRALYAAGDRTHPTC